MFNTLLYTKRLEAAGFSRLQAEAQIQIIAEIVEGELATKRDLKELEYRLIIKLGTIATISIAAMATIVKFF